MALGHDRQDLSSLTLRVSSLGVGGGGVRTALPLRLVEDSVEKAGRTGKTLILLEPQRLLPAGQRVKQEKGLRGGLKQGVGLGVLM